MDARRRHDIFIACFLHTSDEPSLHQMPGSRPPHITGPRVNTVTLAWVGAPKNERAPFKLHDIVIAFVDRCDVC